MGAVSPKHAPLLISLALMLCVISFLLLPVGEAAVGTMLGLAMIAIAYVDSRHFIIPDSLSLTAIPFGLLASGSLINDGVSELAQLDNVVGAIAGGVGLLIVRAVHQWIRQRQGLGLGDAKLAAAAGAWTGVSGLLNVLLLASVCALIVVLVWWAFRKNESEPVWELYIPFGAYLAPAIWFVWMTQKIFVRHGHLGLLLPQA